METIDNTSMAEPLLETSEAYAGAPEIPGQVEETSNDAELPPYLCTEEGVLRDIIELRRKAKEMSIVSTSVREPGIAESTHVMRRVAANLIALLERLDPDSPILEEIYAEDERMNRVAGGIRQAKQVY